jgi:hypothetical protein
MSSSAIADDNTRFYTSFSWEVPQIFGDHSGYPVKGTHVFMLKTATLPSLSYGKIEAKGGGTTTYKFAGAPIYEDITISWYDSIGMVETIKTWMENVLRNDGGMNAPDQYKKTTTLKRFLADRPASQTEIDESVEYLLYGSWPSVLKESDLTYTESTIKTVQLTITYDYYTMSKL